MMLSFRICTEADMETVDPILVAAYNFTGSRKALLLQYWALQPDGWWLALLDDMPVGFGGAVDYGPFSYVGMLCVHPSVQGQGIGEALTKQILEWGNVRGCPALLLNARERAASLYRRLGFLEEAPVLRFTQNKPVVLPPLSSDIQLLHRSDIPNLAAFDAHYFGANRAKVLASYLRENPNGAFVSRNEVGQIMGYIFAEPGLLGPWVASTQEYAERLLLHALSLPSRRNPGLTLPASNTDGQHILERYGFTQQSMNYSMRLGAPTQFRQLNMLYAEASPALG